MTLPKKGWRWRWLWLAMVLQLFSGVAVADRLNHPAVLILHSYHQGYEWSDKELSGILDKLQQVYPMMDPVIEYLDAKRFPGQAQVERMKRYLADKYRGMKIDLVIALDNPALIMAVEYRQEIFPGAALVFAGVNNFQPSMLKGQEKVTGVAEVQDIVGTLKLALSLHPKAKEVLVIHDYTTTGIAAGREVEALLPAFKGRVKVRFTPSATFQEILQLLKSLPPGSLGLITGFATDKNGVSLGLEESTKLLAPAAVPLYAMHATRLGNGIVGGVLLGGREHGRRAGEIALRVLGGEDASRIPVDKKSTAKPMFDYQQLERFGIPLEDLPEDALVINRPVSFYDQNRQWIWGISAITVFLSLVIFVLSTNIVRRRRAEQALVASETRLRSMFDCTGEAMLTVDTGRIITSCNPAFSQLFGYSPAEAIGQSVALIHPSAEHFHKFGEMVYPVIAGTGSWRGEIELKAKDGNLLLTEMSLTSQRLPDGTLMGYIGTHRDIRERKQAEEALRQSEEKYRLVFESAPLGIMHYDQDGTIIELNEAFAQIIGAPRERIIGFNMPRQLQNESVRQALEASLTGQTGYYEGEYLSVTGGKATQVRAFFRGVFSEAGAFLGGISIFEDYTDKFRAEQKQQEYLNFLRTLMDAIPNPVFYKDAAGRYLGCNKACEEAWGILREDLIGKTVFDQHPPDLAEIYYARDAELLTHPGVQVYETNMAHADGTRKDVILLKATFTHLDGSLGGLIGVEMDITERKQAEQALRESEEIFHNLFNNIEVAMFRSRLDGSETLNVNEKFLELVGRSREEVIGKPSVVYWADPRRREEMVRRLKAHGRVVDFEFKMLNKKGEARDCITSLNFYPEEGILDGSILDITERKLAEKALRESEELYRSLFENMLNGFAYCKMLFDGNQPQDFVYLSVNSSFEALTGLKNVLGKKVSEVIPGILQSDPQLFEVYGRVALTGAPERFETYVAALKMWFSVLVYSPKKEYFVSVFDVITERKQAEEKTMASLKEKEVLLKEIHHRVKNNMQIISTLLALQAKYDKDKNPAVVFQDCQNRIRSMALIHESLYNTENLASINFRLYLEKMSTRLLASYGSTAQGVKVTMACADVHLDISQAVPCGLIANELLVNSLKHAFQERKEGEIQVSLEVAGDRRILEVRDNGLGLGPDFDLENPATFGWLMVRNLAKQLGGNFTVQSNGGTSCRIVF